MINCESSAFFSKAEIEHIRDFISCNCSYTDKVMNRLDDLLNHFTFAEENVLMEITTKLYKDEKPELKQIQRLN